MPYIISRDTDRYDLYCLDDGAWDRATWKGTYKTINDATNAAKSLAEDYKVYRQMDLREAVFQLWFKESVVFGLDNKGVMVLRKMVAEDLPPYD